MKKREKIKNLHLKFAESRGLQATYCPSEVARKLDPENWRDSMQIVREVADQLIKEDLLVVVQKGKIRSETATQAHGPIRLQKKANR